jgi:hypothetical protein
MKQEFGGWRLQLTRELQSLLEQYSTPPGSLLPLPASLGSVTSSGDNWDLVSLEGSDLDDCSSVNSSMIFPMLEKETTKIKSTDNLKTGNNPSTTSIQAIPNLTGSIYNSDKEKEKEKSVPQPSPLSIRLGTQSSSFNCRSKTPSPRVGGPPHGGSLSTSMSGDRKAQGLSYKQKYSHVQDHQKSTNPILNGRTSPVNLPWTQHGSRSSSPLSFQWSAPLSNGSGGCWQPKPQQFQKQQFPPQQPHLSSISSNRVPSPTLGHTPSPIGSRVVHPRTHTSAMLSPASSETSTDINSPVPFPGRCCDPFFKVDNNHNANVRVAVAGLHSPAASVASSSLSPCVLPCPSSAGSNKSGYSMCFQRTGDTEMDSDGGVSNNSEVDFWEPVMSSTVTSPVVIGNVKEDSIIQCGARSLLSQSPLSIQGAPPILKSTPSEGINENSELNPALKKGIAFNENLASTSTQLKQDLPPDDTPDEPMKKIILNDTEILRKENSSDVLITQPSVSRDGATDKDSAAFTLPEHEVVANHQSSKKEVAPSKISCNQKSLKRKATSDIQEQDEKPSEKITVPSEISDIPRPVKVARTKTSNEAPLKSKRSVRNSSSRVSSAVVVGIDEATSADPPSTGGRPSRRAATSPAVHRDAFFGSWPTRTQSASKGTWKL